MARDTEMSNPLKFTIVIPTRDRADVLQHALASAVAQQYANLDILVSDNASTDNTAQVVSAFKDKRIRYINTGERLSMSHNWEFALSHVNDGWVTVIGDDDAILPDAIEKVSQIIHETNTQAVRSNGCGYKWPQARASRFGRLSVSLEKGYRQINSATALASVLNGCMRYNDLPMLYNGGFVDTALIKQAKQKSGDFYLSMTPDIYSAIVFALLTKEYVYSSEPLAINGASHHSGGSAVFGKANERTGYDPAKKYWSERNIPFNKSLPLSVDGRPPLSIQALVYEAYLQAAPFIKQPDRNAGHERQLELILRTSGKRRQEMNAWGMVFADMHGLCFETISRKADTPRIAIRTAAGKIAGRIHTLANHYTVRGCVTTPLRNVFEASALAGEIKNWRVSRTRNIVHNLKSFLSPQKI